MVILLGPPGAGKGTNGKKLAQKYNLKHISAGDILREQYPIGTPERNIIDSGGLLDPILIGNTIRQYIINNQYNVILDGFPRVYEQLLQIIDLPIKHIFILEINNEDVLLNRILNRTQCSKCNNIFNTNVICCDINTYRRSDDVKDIFINRLNTYNKNITKILDNLPIKTTKINSLQSIDEVFKDIIDSINI